jgi:hypothetical protein
MKRGIFLVFTLFACEALAQSGFYQEIDYRDNDPFVFCTQGQGWKRAPMQCWIPVPPYTGSFTMMPYCDPPNYWGKTWSDDDWESLGQYMLVCPQAMTSGPWTGKGQPDQDPYDH